MKLIFSVPAYIGAVAAGSFTMAIFVGLALIRDRTPGNAMEAFFAVLVCGGAAAILPALPVFLPATLLSFWLANRFAWRSPLYFGILGVMSSVTTAGIIFFLFQLKFEGVWASAALAAFAFAGTVAALCYRWLDLLSRRKQEIAN